MNALSLPHRIGAFALLLVGLSLGCRGDTCNSRQSPAGPRLEYDIDWGAALDKRLRALGRRLEEEIEDRDEEAATTVEYDDALVVRASDSRELDVVEEVAADQLPGLELADRDGDTLRFELADRAARTYRSDTTLAIKRAVNGSVDDEGFEDAVTPATAGDGFVVRLPEVSDDELERAKRAIEGFQTLRFVFVDDERAESFFEGLDDELPDDFAVCDVHRVPSVVAEGGPKARRALESFFEGRTPDGRMVGYEFARGKDDELDDPSEGSGTAGESVVLGDESSDEQSRSEVCPPRSRHWRTYLLERDARLQGDHVLDARAAVDREIMKPVLHIDFTDEGADLLADITAENVDRRMAMVVGSLVHSAPLIRESIPGGALQLSVGSLQSFQRSQREVRDLANMLRAQLAPVELELVAVHRGETE